MKEESQPSLKVTVLWYYNIMVLWYYGECSGSRTAKHGQVESVVIHYACGPIRAEELGLGGVPN